MMGMSAHAKTIIPNCNPTAVVDFRSVTTLSGADASAQNPPNLRSATAKTTIATEKSTMIVRAVRLAFHANVSKISKLPKSSAWDAVAKALRSAA
jgi:hypothetical protein